MKIRPKQIHNKISTCGYFIKRLKDSGLVVWRIFSAYGEHDPRRWTVLIDPGGASVYVTCYHNKDFINQIVFEFSDGGQRYIKNFNLITDSIEVVINSLHNHGIFPNTENVFKKSNN